MATSVVQQDYPADRGGEKMNESDTKPEELVTSPGSGGRQQPQQQQHGVKKVDKKLLKLFFLLYYIWP